MSTPFALTKPSVRLLPNNKLNMSFLKVPLTTHVLCADCWVLTEAYDWSWTHRIQTRICKIQHNMIFETTTEGL